MSASSTPPAAQDQSFLRDLLTANFERVEKEKEDGVIQPIPNYPSTIHNTATIQTSTSEHIQPEIVPIDGMCAISILGLLLLSPQNSRVGFSEKGVVSIQSSETNLIPSDSYLAKTINTVAAKVYNGAARYVGNQNGDQLSFLHAPIKETFKVYNVRNSHITIKFQAAIGGLLILEKLYADRTVLSSLKDMRNSLVTHLEKNHIDPFPTLINTYLIRYHGVYVNNPPSPSITPRYSSSPIDIPQGFSKPGHFFASPEYPALTPITTYETGLYLYGSENNFKWDEWSLINFSESLTNIILKHTSPTNATPSCTLLQELITNHGGTYFTNLALIKSPSSPYVSRP